MKRKNRKIKVKVKVEKEIFKEINQEENPKEINQEKVNIDAVKNNSNIYNKDDNKDLFKQKREELKKKQFRDKLNCEKILLMNDLDKEKLLRLNQWSLEKMYLSKTEKNDISPILGEIWKVRLGENIGSEMNKTRYCIVASYNNFNIHSNLCTIIPITSNEKNEAGTHFYIKDFLTDSSESLEGVAKTEMLRTVSKSRFCYKAGSLTEEGIKQMKKTLLMHFGLSEYQK